MKKLRASALLMMIAMIGVTGFQAWWLKNNYAREKQNLDIRASAAFRETLLELQAAKLKLTDLELTIDSGLQTTMVVTSDKKGKYTVDRKTTRTSAPISLIHLLQERMKDSLKHDSGKTIRIAVNHDDIDMDKQPVKGENILIENSRPADSLPGKKGLVRFLTTIDSATAKDSIKVKELDSAFKRSLKEENLRVGALVSRLDSAAGPRPNEVSIGFASPVRYDYFLSDTSGYMFNRLKLPLLFSLLLVGITIASFVLLYRNLMRQKRLAELKNEFISNISHELKTPIATVGVALEALKNFRAMDDPRRTEEYLDISQQELQRLNLLVDKVLKLSMFENHKMEMEHARFDLGEVAQEVVRSMRLQLEKYGAHVDINLEGDLHLIGDRMHLLSVLFNLLDNALKYGKTAPEILIEIKEKPEHVELLFRDNGMGIASAYQDKVFEKFFRVPHGDEHSAKGYGLGLSYVAQVIKEHGGQIRLNSEEGKGTEFIIEFPKPRS